MIRTWQIEFRHESEAPLDRWCVDDETRWDHDASDPEAVRRTLDALRAGVHPEVPADVAKHFEFRATRVEMSTEVEAW